MKLYNELWAIHRSSATEKEYMDIFIDILEHTCD